jgi:hypothetical protein
VNWASIPKVVGAIPTVARHIFQACPVWIYTQSNITSIVFDNVDNMPVESEIALPVARKMRPVSEFQG